MRRKFAALAVATFTIACRPPGRPAISARPPEGDVVASGGARIFGRSFLRERHGVLEGRFVGPPYERGFARGRLTYDQIAAGERRLSALLDRLVPSNFRRWVIRQLLASSMRRSAPEIPTAHLEEIAGMTDAEQPDPLPGGWPPYERQLSLHALHDFSQRFTDSIPLSGACTGFAATPPATRDGHVYLARNFDFEASTDFDREKIVAAIVPDGGHRYLTVTFGGMTGVVSGMNDAGLAISLQAMAGAPTASAGEPTTLLAADVLEHDVTVEEAAARIAGARVFVSDIYLLADASGHLAVAEKTPRAFALRRDSPTIWATNSAQDPKLRQSERAANQSTSDARGQRLAEILAGSTISPVAAAAILRDRLGPGGRNLGPGNRNAIDALIAAHSVIFDLTARRAWVAAFPHTLGEYVAFDLSLLASAAPDDPGFAELSRLDLPADRFLTSGDYARYKTARESLAKARREIRDGRNVEAIADASLALTLAPDLLEALVARGEARLRRGEFAEAAKDLGRAEELFPGPPDFASEIAALRASAAARLTPKRLAKFPLSIEELLADNRDR